MNLEFAEQINTFLEKLAFEKALNIAENELRIPSTDFHFVIGKSLVGQAEDLAFWIEDFYRKATQKFEVQALYFEMNEFDINTDQWYIDGFTFSNDGGLDLNDLEWLCEYDTDSQTETDTVFQIQGYGELQRAFENDTINTDDLQNARDWSEQIIIARFMELMRSAHLTAKAKGLKWAKLPIYFAEHAYDFIVKSDGGI